ncbi:alpha/beta hydrolase [Microbacterium sp. BK668]|uniref:alpha/beta fold hydrolase n=1 Tax=Microbacterium sp. BK668 TaxID=2512118 RepID=UPI00105FFE62|nr:alpha/beta hydrolase [Microbacterium sp. BK668]TDN91814.1 alpha-beta hydrolase superfamily lysophospholipase [Microbacterium sp. BK668]
MPSSARVGRFTWRGATIVLESTGAGERTFVLVHGIGMGRSVFSDLAQHLRPRGRVVTIDLPGYGEAPEPPRTLTVERSADVVAAYLRDARHSDVTLIGHSMGAQIAVEVEARHPALVRRLVLAGPTVDPRARTARAQLARLLRDIAVERPVVWARGAREYLRAGPHLRAKMRAMLAHRIEHTLPRVAVPVLVLRGADDLVAPRDWCEAVVALLPDGVLAEIADHGHETMIRDSSLVADLIVGFARQG